MWVAIHKCMEATLGISLYRYLYPRLAKTLCLSYYLLCFLFNKIGEEEGRTCGGEQKNDTVSIVGKWMELESIILNKIRQIQKDRDHVFFPMWKQGETKQDNQSQESNGGEVEREGKRGRGEGRWKEQRRGEPDLSTLSVCMEVS
jgi:hypothetical protein